MKYAKVFNRRTLLRGAGSIAIALPFIDEMRVNSVYAAAPEPPARSITFFWGEGLPRHAQDEFLADLSGPLEPLAKHRPKLGFIRGLGYLEGFGAHEAGPMMAFTGAPDWPSQDQAGGPSLDQVMLQELYGAQPPPIPTLAMGFYGSYRDPGGDANGYFRRVKSWKNDGSPSEIPKAFPSELFTRIFGTGEPMDDAEKRAQRSILDSVLAQYQHLSSDASNLSIASRARIKDHLDRVRQFELQIFGDKNCTTPDPVVDPPLYNGQASFNGVDLTVDDITAHWRLNVDLFVMALRCDLTRIGIAHFLNVGDRIDLKGDYVYEGNLVFNFDDSRDLPNPDEGLAVNHEHFHAWNTANQSGATIAKHHTHFYMREISHLLSQLDDPEHTDENGGTLLDNAMVMGTTELTEPGQHLVSGVLHIVGSANERFKVGGNITVAGDDTRPAADLYNTALRAYGIDDRTLGPTLFTGTVDEALI